MGRFGKFLGIKILGAVLAMGRFGIAPNNQVCRHTCFLLPFSYSYSTALRLHHCVKIRRYVLFFATTLEQFQKVAFVLTYH